MLRAGLPRLLVAAVAEQFRDARVIGLLPEAETPGLFVLGLDVGLQHAAFHPPLPAATDLDRRQLSGAHQCIRLARRHVEHFGGVGQGEKSGEAAGWVGVVHASIMGEIEAPERGCG